jgi:hypothetical protein
VISGPELQLDVHVESNVDLTIVGWAKWLISLHSGKWSAFSDNYFSQISAQLIRPMKAISGTEFSERGVCFSVPTEPAKP